MGKFIIMYGLPAAVLLPTIWWAVRRWYLTSYGDQIKAQKQVRQKTAKYEQELGITSKEKRK